MFRMRKKQSGFSLPELAIVMVSIAAITAAVAGGARIIETAKNAQSKNNILAIKQAVDQFEEQYGGLPGDLAYVTKLGAAANKAGNGNGVIDSATEALLFWHHLGLAGLIDGKYDGATATVGVGLPPGSQEHSVLKVIPVGSLDSSYPSDALVIQVSGAGASGTDLGIFAVDEARKMDESLDGGVADPVHGKVRAIDGNGSTCLSGSNYKTSTNTTTESPCVIRYILRGFEGVKTTFSFSGNVCSDTLDREQVASGKTTSSSGANIFNLNTTPYTILTISACPAGTIGIKTLKCVPSANNGAGSWTEVQENNCQQVKCYENSILGDSSAINCINNYTGNGVIRRCEKLGLWQPISSGNTCTPQTNAEVCNGSYVSRKSQGCNFGQKGARLHQCDGGFWKWADVDGSGDDLNADTTSTSGTHTINDSCTNISCSGSGTIGATGVSKTDFNYDCTAITYSGVAAYTGSSSKRYSVCSLDGKWHFATAECVPNYAGITSGTCTDGAVITDIGCPPGKRGTHSLRCSGTKWVEDKDNCEALTCGGYPLGEFRASPTQKCPENSNGIVWEICVLDIENGGSSYNKAVWKPTFLNCVRGTGSSDGVNQVCLGDSAETQSDRSGNAYWPSAISPASGTVTVTATACRTGYTGTLPTRTCGTSGVWGSVTGACTKIQCPAISTADVSTGYATWPVSDAGALNVTGTCDTASNYYAQGSGFTPPTRNCNIDGTWAALSNPCQ